MSHVTPESSDNGQISEIIVGFGEAPTTPTPIETATSYKVLIGEVDYTNNTQIGMNLKDTLTEELDEMTIIINGISRTNFDAFTDVEVNIPTLPKMYFYINTSSEDIIDYENMIYSYTISLISRTKILERVYIPNLKISKYSATRNTKSIYDYLAKVVMKYVYNQFPFLSLDYSMRSLTMNCPEIEWGKGTNAKQVFNDLLATIPNSPKLVRIANNKIGFVELNKVGSDISNLNYVDDEQYQQMSDHANSIIMDAQNVIPNKVNRVVVVSPRVENVARLTSDNAEIIIPNAKIENITKLIIHASFYIRRDEVQYGSSSGAIWVTRDLDITNYVKEKSVYDTCDTGNGNDTSYKELNLYFSKGDNAIKGLGKTEEWWGASATIYKIIQHCYNSLNEEIDGANFIFQAIGNADIRNYIFKVEYIDSTDTRIKIKKDIPEDKDVAIYVSQNQSAIDMKALMKAQRENVNRLGNEIRVLCAVVDYSHIPNLADYVGEYILAQRELSFFNDFVLVKGTFSKNYIQKNIYYGLQSRKKYTQLAQTNETVVREDVHSIKVKLSNQLETIGDLIPTAKYFAHYFSGDCVDRSVKSFYLKTNEISDGFSIIPSALYGDKSVILTGQCYDNYSVGMMISLSDGNYLQDYVQYVNQYGEMSTYSVSLFTQYVDGYDDIDVQRAFPKVQIGSDGIMYGNNKNYIYFKDNAETLKITYQFDFDSEDENIIVGTGIGTNNSLVVKGVNNTVKWYYSITTRIDKRYPVLSSSDFSEFLPNIAVGNNGNITINGISNILDFGYDVLSVACVNSDNNELIFAINKPKNSAIYQSIYFNVKGE